MDKLIYQQQSKGCGYAAIKMLLVHYSGNKSYAHIKEPKCINETPSLNSLVLWASQFGLTLTALKATSKTQLLKNNIFPILLVLNENERNHCVYLYKRKGNLFYVLDPEKGRVRYRVKDLIDIFTGVYLTATYTKVSDEEEIKPIKIGFVFERIIQCFLETVSLISIFTAFYYISDDGNFLSPLLLFIFFVFVKFFQRFLLEKSLKKFDDKYSNIIDKKSYKEKEVLYKFYLDFKTEYFAGPTLLLSSIIETSILAVLLCLNDIYYCLGLSVSLLIVLITFLITNKTKSKNIRQLEIMELNYLGKDARFTNFKAVDLLNSAYKIAKINSVKELFFIFADLVICLLICLFSQIVTLNYMLFSIMTIFYIQERLSTFLDKYRLFKDFDRHKAYFIGYFK